jgi:phage major head subunit gpT-like protein
MPTISPAVVAQISGGVNGRFATGLAGAQSFYPRVAEIIPSSKAFEIYPFDNMWPSIEEWIGARQIKQLKTQDFTITNKHFEGTLSINADKVADSDVAALYPRAEKLGRAAGVFPDKLITTLIQAGFATLCYDGQYFFDTDHPMGSTVGSNTGTTALSATSYAAARAAMGAFTNDSGEPLGIIPNLLMVPPALEGMARSILNADIVVAGTADASGVTNVWRGSADLLVNPWLTDANNWYLFATNQLMPALVYQERQPARIVPKVDMRDDNLFMLNELRWGVDLRSNAGYAAWQCGFGAAVT